MRFFVLKKPAYLDFNAEHYTEEASLKSRHQILSNGASSNAKLVRLRNGEWCIRYGNTMLEMRSVESKPMKVSVLDGKGGRFLDTVDCKWFLQSKQEGLQ